jgi:hypothetical protein
VALADRSDRRHVGGLAVEVDRDDRLGARGDRGLDRGRVDVVGVGLDVHEDGLRTGAPDRAAGGEEGVRRGDDLIAGRQVDGHQRQQEGVGAGRAADGVGRAHVFADLRLQAADLGAHHEALGLQDLPDDRLDLVADRLVLGAQIQRRHAGRLVGNGHGRSLLRRPKQSRPAGTRVRNALEGASPSLE